MLRLMKHLHCAQTPGETPAQVCGIVFPTDGADIAINRAECNCGQQHRRISVTGWELKECAENSSFAPLGLDHFRHVPTAYAVGCTLSSLRG